MTEDDLEKALDSLRFQIKKEIVDHYFAERVYLEEEAKALEDEAAAYREEVAKAARLFHALYAALKNEQVISRVMAALGLSPWPFYDEFQKLTPAQRQALLAHRPARGFTAWRRFRNLVLGIYEELQKTLAALQERHHKLQIHLTLLNEDIQKFNASFDFGLIAAQIEAMEGGGEVISGGLFAPEREELSTRMRFKRRKLTAEEAPALPVLPPLEQVKGKLHEILAQVTP
ncbi:MAG: hypothetical protein WHT07_11880 [Desulfobaccales bacterium]